MRTSHQKAERSDVTNSRRRRAADVERVASYAARHSAAKRAATSRTQRSSGSMRSSATASFAGSKSKRFDEEEPRRVADLAIRLGRALEDLLRDRVVVRVVERRDPEPDHVGAVRLDDVVRLDRVSERLRHLPAVARHDEAVREHGVVRGAARERDGREERRLEPAAMLVVALEVDDRRRGLRRVRVREAVVARAEHGRVRHARVEPDVEDVLDLLEVRAAAARARGRRRRGRGRRRGRFS